VNILVIEDDLDIQELICEFLRSQHYEVDAAGDGLEGFRRFQQGRYDLVLLDLMMPNMDGYHVCQLIRSLSSVPIIVLTALDDEREQVKGFELGIDDYVTKPFSFNILIKRVEAVLRRARSSEPATILQFHEVAVDKNGFAVTVDGSKVELTAKEFDILCLLMENKGRVVTRETLLDHAWGYDYYGDARIVDTHIKNLRKKLGVPYIKTAKGIGYKIDE